VGGGSSLPVRLSRQRRQKLVFVRTTIARPILAYGLRFTTERRFSTFENTIWRVSIWVMVRR